jgi:hypothetical protein
MVRKFLSRRSTDFLMSRVGEIASSSKDKAGGISVRPTTMHAISVLYRTVTRASGADEVQPDSGFSA